MGILSKYLASIVLIATGISILPKPMLGQDFSIRNNIIYDASGTPNIGVEFPVSEHWSVGANAGLKPWPRFFMWDGDTKENTSHWKHFLVAPELRYYLDEIYSGWFFGSDLVYTHYNTGNVRFPFGMYKDVRDHRVQGDFIGLGLFAGRSWWIADHWRLEAELGLAIGGVFQGRYDCGHCGSKLGDEKKPALVPKLGLNIAYNLLPKQTASPEAPLAPEQPSRPEMPEAATPPAFFDAKLSYAEAPLTAGDRIAKELPWVLPYSQYIPTSEFPRKSKDSLLYVYFPVNRTELLRNFPKDKAILGRHQPNGVILDTMTAVINRIIKDPRCGLKLIQIVGLASVEGPYKHNVFLGDGRAEALKSYLKKELSLDDSRFEAAGMGEAWEWFQARMNEIAGKGGHGLSKQDVGKILGIINGEQNPDRREQLLKSDKALYSIIRDSILADQRNSGYIRAYFENKPDPETEELNRLISLVKSGSLDEAMQYAESDRFLKDRIGGNAEAGNALAIAILTKALENNDGESVKYALKLLESAANAGSEDAAYNLKAASEHLAAVEAYKRHEAERLARYEAELEKYNQKLKEYEAAKAIFDVEYGKYVKELERYNRRYKNKK